MPRIRPFLARRFLRHADRPPPAGANAYQPTALWNVLLHPVSTDQRNQRSVLIDSVGVGICAGVGSFLSVFLVRLGASNFLVGMLTAMPALTGMLLAMAVGEFLARRPNIVPWFARSRFVVLSCYVLTGLVPFVLRNHQAEAIIMIWALATLPQTIVSIAFTVVMGAVAGPGGRLTLMSRRWSILGLSNAVTVLAVGQVLELFQFPLNYQLVFIGSAIGALISVIFSSSIKLPPAAVPAERQSLVRTIRKHWGTLRNNRAFVNFTISQFVFQWGVVLAVPLFPIYWVHNVHASDPTIGAINSAMTAVTMIAYFLWARISQRRGERLVLLITTLGVSLYPLANALTQNIPLLVIWAGLAGFFAAGVNLVFFDILLSTCPVDQQASYVGMYQTTVFVANFLAPLVGTTVADSVGIIPALILATVLRLVGLGLMVVLGVGRSEPT